MTAREAAVRNAAQTPMREHVERFWRLLETEHVRILVEIRRDHSSIPYWDSSSFPDDIAKVIADDHRALQSHEAAPAATQSGEPIAWMADAAQPTLNRHELVDGGFTEAEIIPLYTAPPAPAGALSDSDDAYATALRCAWDCWTTRTEKDLAAFDFSLQHAVGILQMAALSAPVGADWRVSFKLVPVEPLPEMIAAGRKASLALQDRMIEAAKPYEPVVLPFDMARMLVEYRAMLDAAPAPPQTSGADWRTIDSAPKDGRYILAGRFRDTELKWVKHSRWMTAEEAAEDSGVPDDYCAGWTDGEGEYDYCCPTHWMPLPATPKPEGE